MGGTTDGSADPPEAGEHLAPPADGSGTKPKLRARARARYEVATVRAEQTWRRVEGSRSRLLFVDVAFETYERDRNSAGGLLAGAMAFRLFLWIVPYTLAIVVILGFVSEIENTSPDHVAKDAGFGAYLATTVAQSTSQSPQGRWVLLIVALWALFLASRGLAKTLRTSHALAWGMPIGRRGTTRLALQIGGFLAGLSFISSVAGALRARISGPALWIMLVMIVLYFLAWLWVSIHLPHGDAPWTALLPGSLLLALGAQALYLISVLWYMPKAASATQTYGSLGLAILFLGWLYILGRLMVASAMVNATLWARRWVVPGLGRFTRTAPPPAPEDTSPDL